MPPFKYAAINGAINANELPKYTGDFPLVHNIYINVPIPDATSATGIVNTSSPAP